MIGCGAIAKLHLKALQAVTSSSVQIVGLVDPKYEAATSLKKQISQTEKCEVGIHNVDLNVCKSGSGWSAMYLIP